MAQQPDLIPNPIGTSINHLISFMCLSALAFIVRAKEKKFINSIYFFLIISIMFEILHNFIPNRAFEYYDLFANVIGVTFTYLLIQLIQLILKKKIK